MRRSLRIVFLLICHASPAAYADRQNGQVDSVRIEQKELTYRATILAVASAEKEETINCPVSWTPIKFVVQDGEYVEKGDLIAEFDTDRLRYDLRMLEYERDMLSANLAKDWTTSQNKDLDQRDKLEELKDNLAYLEAKLACLRAMPLEDEVRIAEGRLKIAVLNREAAEKDLAKARDRLSRGMISSAEMAEFEKKYQEKKALETNATDQLEYARLPASSSTIRKTDLEILNARQEIDQITHQLSENIDISEIQKKGIEAQKEVINQRIREKQEEIDRSRILAPLSGNVMHTREFKAELASHGGKMWKNQAFMKIPDPSKQIFKGAVRESDHKHFRPGDPVLLRVAGRPNPPIEGIIQSFSALSRDWFDKEESEFEWGGTKAEGGSGIKVYDVVIRLVEQQDWVRPGMSASCEIMSSRKESGPCVPLTYAKEKDGEFYLSFGGRYEQVKGQIVEGHVLLEDESLLGRSVDLYGEFKDEKDLSGDGKAAGRFQASGELLPVKTTDVFVQDVLRWPKISWLIAEDTRTVEGQVVAKLDTKEVDDDLHKFNSELATIVSEKDALIKQRELKIREGAFNLGKEKNLLEIAEIELALAEGGRDLSALYDAELARRQAEIKLEDVARRLEWAESRRAAVLSPAELTKLKREKQRQSLKLEESKLKLSKLERGSTDVEISQAKLKRLEQKTRVEVLEKNMEEDNYQITQSLLQAENHATSHLKFIDRVTFMKTSCTLISPATGLVQYAKIYNSDMVTKPAVGIEVGPGFKLMQIADVSQMYIRVEVPEKYYCFVKEGMPVEVQVPSMARARLKGTVSGIDFLFVSKRKDDSNAGLYSSHERLGETVFYVRVDVLEEEGMELKPGAVAVVVFPFSES